MRASAVVIFALFVGVLTRPGAADDAFEPPDIRWQLADADSRANTMRFLAAQIRANFEKIKNLKAHCLVHQRQQLTKEYVASAFAANIDSSDIAELVQEMDFAFDVVMDFASGSVYRFKDTKTMRFLRVPSLEEVTVRNVTPTDRKSVVTAEHYLFFAPKDPPATYTFVEHHPEARSKRAARRVPTSQAQRQQFGDLIDPRYFFGASEKRKFWEELGNYGNALDGRFGAEVVSDARGGVDLYEAENADGKWFKVRTKHFVSGDDDPYYYTTVFGESNGFNPMSRVFSQELEGMAPSSSALWRWRDSGEAFVPELVLERRQNGMLERRVELKQCTVNEPLDAHQFDIQAFGLAEGDLILDEIDRVAFIMRNGEPERLAAFGEQYVPPDTAVSRRRWWLVASTVAAVILLWIVFRSTRAVPNVDVN